MGCVKTPVQVPRRKNSMNLFSSILTTQDLKMIVIQNLKQHVSFFKLQGQESVELLIRGTKNGFTANKFHELTNGATHTLLLVRTKNNAIFGGYTPCAWKDHVMYQKEEDANKMSFLFAIRDGADKKYSIQIFGLEQKQKQCAIMNCEDQGPIFGAGHDLHLTDQCNKNQNWANMGKSYASIHKFGSNKANSQLAGQVRFIVDDYQVWKFQCQ